MGLAPRILNLLVPVSSGTDRDGSVQLSLVECGEILESDFPKRFSMLRLVPVLPVDGEGLVVMALEKQGVGKVPLDENHVFPVLFWDRVADLINQPVSFFAACLGLRELPIQDQIEGEIAKCR